MTYPKLKPCPSCGEDTDVYGYDHVTWTNWRVECDNCWYIGPCGTKLQAMRGHNARCTVQVPA